MDEKKQQVRYDAGSFEVLTAAVRAAVNRFPGLRPGEQVAFATLRDSGGMALFPGSGAVIEQERRSVTGRIRQVCLYPFVVLYRGGGLSEEGRASAKEWLDELARWLEQLRTLPELEGQRKLLGFAIQTPAYLYDVDESHVETWAVALAARYENIYQK